MPYELQSSQLRNYTYCILKTIYRCAILRSNFSVIHIHRVDSEQFKHEAVFPESRNLLVQALKALFPRAIFTPQGVLTALGSMKL
jgi:hypothetical protein